VSLKLLVTDAVHLDGEALSTLRSVADVVIRTSTDVTPGDFAAYDAIWLRLSTRIGPDHLGTNPRCRFIAVPATGIDHIDAAACRSRGISIVSLQGETEFLGSVRATAEHTLGLLLALARRLPSAHAGAVAGRWNREEHRGTEILDKTAAVIGHGRLGSMVCTYLQALGASVISFDPTLERSDDGCSLSRDLGAALRAADVVTVHASLTDANVGFIGTKEFAMMERAPLFVNTARGPLVDSAALAHALEAGIISGAAIDVIEGEPSPPADNPLFEYARSHDNLIITPHIAGNTVESGQKTDRFLARKLADHLAAVS
jgi:D-3-phosphoglycerate dehydrogenase